MKLMKQAVGLVPGTGVRETKEFEPPHITAPGLLGALSKQDIVKVEWDEEVATITWLVPS